MKTGSIKNNDEVRIPIQDLDYYTLYCNSYLDIVGKLEKVGGVSIKLKFINNGVVFLSNCIVIDSVRNVRLASTIKNHVSLNKNESVFLENAGWFIETQTAKGDINERKSIIVDKNGNFNMCIPLKLL